jgi:putative hemolysin
MRQLALVVTVVSILVIAACGSAPTPTPAAESPQTLPNPASQFCIDQGYQLEIRTAADGSQAGYCLFPDGTECDEWAFYRGECGPGTPNPQE